MSTIRKHLITSKDLTPIYSFENLSGVIAKIARGSWVGVLERKTDRLRVICTSGEGWMKSDDVEETNKYNFRVFHDENGMLQYGVL
jgi:hypothetical protein